MSHSARETIVGWSLFSALLLALCIPLLFRQDNEWEGVFVKASRHLWAGEDIYRAEDGYLYPPFTAWLTLPAIALAHDLSRFAFVTINGLCLGFVLRAGWLLADGNSLADRRSWLAMGLGGACGIFYAANCLAHQQTDLILTALVTIGCLALRWQRPMLGAVGFGLAAAMKCTPLLWAPYLLWRGRPVAAAIVIGVALGANMLPDLVNTPPSGDSWLGEYAKRWLKPLLARDHVAGSWGSEIVYNQSLAGAGQRWLMTTPRWNASDCTVEKMATTVTASQLRTSVLGVEILLLVLSAIACRRPLQRVTDPEKQVTEFGIVLTLMLLLSPMSSMAHFGVLLLPGFALARRALQRHDGVLLAFVCAAACCALCSNKDLIGGRLYTLALWSGCVMGSALFLLMGSVFTLLLPGQTVVEQAQSRRLAA